MEPITFLPDDSELIKVYSNNVKSPSRSHFLVQGLKRKLSPSDGCPASVRAGVEPGRCGRCGGVCCSPNTEAAATG